MCSSSGVSLLCPSLTHTHAHTYVGCVSKSAKMWCRAGWRAQGESPEGREGAGGLQLSMRSMWPSQTWVRNLILPKVARGGSPMGP